MPLLIDSAAVHAAVPPRRAVEVTRDAFLRHHAGEWQMPPKVYVDSPPGGDFRAMPARGGGYACLKWVTSFPANPARGLPVVTGALLLSDATTGALLAIVDCAAVTSLRTGAAAAVSAGALAASGARRVGLIGCGVNGSWAARCLDAGGYGPGLCADSEATAAEALAGELGWAIADRAEAAAQEIVVTVTPGERPVIAAGELRPGAHVAALGADAYGKAEIEPAELDRCSLFCDEWEQAAAGGELSAAVDRGLGPGRVAAIGAVLAGDAPGRRDDQDITLFDSTGLAIQDLAIAIAAYEAASQGRVGSRQIELEAEG